MSLGREAGSRERPRSMASTLLTGHRGPGLARPDEGRPRPALGRAATLLPSKASSRLQDLAPLGAAVQETCGHVCAHILQGRRSRFSHVALLEYTMYVSTFRQ